MNAQRVIQVYPPSGKAVSLPGLYLAIPLDAGGAGRPLVYSNFVTSLDGRIAIADPSDGVRKVPPQTANPRDWRLFQELAARADLLITSGRYLRDLAAGQAQDILPLSPDAEFADLHHWRKAQGMPAQPDVAVFSASLDFPVPEDALAQGRRLLVFTGMDADPGAADVLERRGAQVITCGSGAAADAGIAMDRLGELGYRRAYSITGPYVLRSLLSAGVLDALFVTTVSRILAGSEFTTLAEGPLLEQPADFRLTSLYLDQTPDVGEQLLARYDRATVL